MRTLWIKGVCIIEGGVIKEKCLDFPDHQHMIAGFLLQQSIFVSTD
jgi:hypothetical protein